MKLILNYPHVMKFCAVLGIVAIASHLSAEDVEPVNVPNAVAESSDAMKPYAEIIEHTDVVIDMVPIPGGKFTMGSPKGEPDRREDEGPQHQVEIAPFWMGKYEITWNQYEIWGENIDIARRQIFASPTSPRDEVADVITRPTPPYTDMSFGMGKLQNPAICMTQHAARMYCEWLSAKTGRYYRLPTEAEWEYACRAGTSTAFSFGDDVGKLDEYAWHKGNSEEHYHDVGQKKPNPWGLYDMHGNVAEWVLDQYVPDQYGKHLAGVRNPLAIPDKLYPRTVRGGAWNSKPEMLRSAARVGSDETWKEQDPQIPQSIWYHTDAHGVGFRVVRPLEVPSDEERVAKWDKTAPEQKDPDNEGS